MRTASYFIAAVLGLALTLGPVPAQAETTACTPITSLPATITVQGIYCFTQHLNTSITTGAAIDIQTNNVILDLNGWKLGGLAAGPGTEAVGILAVDRQNITIKNGTVRGFWKGILLGGGQGHVVEDIRADQNLHRGIEAAGDGILIRNNQVFSTGGSPIGGAESAYGITVAATGPRVLNNDVIDTFKQGDGTAWGIQLSGAGGLAVNNRITNAEVGIGFGPSSTGKYRDNLTANVGTPFSGGTAVGTNH